jgi:O-antigen/teichoic acid export membrane protein
MLDKLKHTFKHSVVYSVSNVLTKAAGIILIPIYTDYFKPEEYGDLGLLLITITIISQVLAAGQGLAILRYNNDNSFKENREKIFFTLTVLLFILVFVFTVLAELFIPYLAFKTSNPNKFKELFRITTYIISFTVLNILFLNKLRGDERSIAYSTIGVIKLLLTLVITIVLIVYFNQNIEAVLYGQLAGELLNFVVIIPMVIKSMEFKFYAKIIPDSMKFGLPLIFSALAMNLLNGSDRYVLKYLSGASQLGLYELAYKFSGIINMFLIMPFSLTLLPVAYKYYKTEGDKRFYSKLMTYLAFILIWASLLLSLIGKELIELFSSSAEYYPAYTVVPLINLSYVFFGLSMITSLGMYLTGNTKSVAYINLFAAALNIGLNFILIPKLGMMGAAINTLIAFIALVILTYIVSNKYYKIEYETGKILLLIILATIIYFICLPLNNLSIFIALIIKITITLLFPFLLILFKFYELNEILTIKKIFTGILNLANNKDKLSDLIKELTSKQK